MIRVCRARTLDRLDLEALDRTIQDKIDEKDWAPGWPPQRGEGLRQPLSADSCRG